MIEFAAGGMVRANREHATRRQLVNVYVTGRSGSRLLLVLTEPEVLGLVRELLAAGDVKPGDLKAERDALLRFAEGRR